MKNLFYDGFNSELIETAFFDGIFEIPILKAPSEIVLPTVAVPFDRSSAVSQFPALRFPIFLLQPVLKPQNVPDLLTPDSTLCKILPQPRHHFRVKITFPTDFILL